MKAFFSSVVNNGCLMALCGPQASSMNQKLKIFTNTQTQETGGGGKGQASH